MCCAARDPKLRASLQRHGNAAVRAEGNERLGLHGMAGNEAEAKALREGADHSGRFEKREALADAAARAVAKRKIRAGRKALGEAVAPTFGAIGFGVVEEARIAMRDPLREKKRGALGKIVADDLR